MDQQFLAQGLPSSSLYQLATGVTLYIVDVLPQWTSLKCGLPHQFSLATLGGPEAGWHLDMHGHVTTTPSLLAMGRPAAVKVCRGPRSTSGLPLIGSRVKYLLPPWLGRVCWLGWRRYQDYGVFLGALQECQAVAQVRACLVGGNEDEGCPKHYGRLTLIRGRQHITDKGQHMPSVLQVAQHVPHLRAGEPVIQYFCINQGDWKGGCRDCGHSRTRVDHQSELDRARSKSRKRRRRWTPRRATMPIRPKTELIATSTWQSCLVRRAAG